MTERQRLGLFLLGFAAFVVAVAVVAFKLRMEFLPQFADIAYFKRALYFVCALILAAMGLYHLIPRRSRD